MFSYGQLNIPGCLFIHTLALGNVQKAATRFRSQTSVFVLTRCSRASRAMICRSHVTAQYHVFVWTIEHSRLIIYTLPCPMQCAESRNSFPITNIGVRLHEVFQSQPRYDLQIACDRAVPCFRMDN